MTDTYGWTMITRGLEVMEKPDTDGEMQLCVNVDGREAFFYLSPAAAAKFASILMAAQASPPTPEPMRECLEWIASQTNLFFAECSQAEEIIHRVKVALAASPPTPDAETQP